MNESANERLGLPRDTMKKVTIAFDVDGTLRDGTKGSQVVANERIRTLLVTLASFKNVRIIVWSGGGQLYAAQMAREFHIGQHVDEYMGKVEAHAAGFKPDIAIDDIQDTALGVLNLIVREK